MAWVFFADFLARRQSDSSTFIESAMIIHQYRLSVGVIPSGSPRIPANVLLRVLCCFYNIQHLSLGMALRSAKANGLTLFDTLSTY